MGLRVLVVEDDLPTLELMQESLSQLGAEVVPLSDSRDAVERVSYDKFDGIFLDLQMPHVDGFHLARRIRSSSANRTTPVIIVTGRVEYRTMQDCFAVGGTFFLQKPIDRFRLGQLFASVKGNMMDNRRKYLRVSMSTELRCEIEGYTLPATSLNISQSGMLLDLGRTLPVNTHMRIHFRFPQQHLVLAPLAEVIRVDGNRIALRFISLSESDQKALRAYIDVHAEVAGITETQDP